MMDATLVLVHGFFSNERTWDRFAEVITADGELAGVTIKRFSYATPVLRLGPLRRIPDLADMASSFREWLRGEPQDRPVVIVSHSMGGLVAQRFLAERLRAGRLDELSNIVGVVMFACPNQGSDLLRALRHSMRWWSHPQERQLRPLNEEVTAAQQVVIERIVHCASARVPGVPIPIWAIAGESDGVVRSGSATFVFDDERRFTLPGDHSTVIRPDSTVHRSHLTLKRALAEALRPFAARDTTPTSLSPAPPPERTSGPIPRIAQSIADSTIGSDAVQISGVRRNVHLNPRPTGTPTDR
ncbi:esterase/lipase family protein [Nocardia sp. NPDC058705]|uniref:esterase/lipase family protein n=1 Tax=Nocardia sp. NPDC058705 TaxID=3346609 RepID=UPI0036A1D499